jgi:hypothetical protein
MSNARGPIACFVLPAFRRTRALYDVSVVLSDVVEGESSICTVWSDGDGTVWSGGGMVEVKGTQRLWLFLFCGLLLIRYSNVAADSIYCDYIGILLMPFG